MEKGGREGYWERREKRDLITDYRIAKMYALNVVAQTCTGLGTKPDDLIACAKKLLNWTWKDDRKKDPADEAIEAYLD